MRSAWSREGHQRAGSFAGCHRCPLHAHTQGQRPVDPADALASLLLTAGVPAAQIPPGLEARAARWRDQVAGKKVLLLLDDAAGHEQVRPLLPGTAGSLVLITSRRRLAALEDAAVISLDTLPPVEAVTLLTRLAARSDLGPTSGPAEEITRLCGYLPLAIGMLASQLRHHPAWSVTQLAAELAAAKDRLVLMHAENLSVATAFGLSYADLTVGQQRLFRRLGLVPGPDFDAHAAAALDGTRLDAARRSLESLYDQHLLTEPAPGRYQLHDLLREHARALAVADKPAESDGAAGRLLDYYLHTALAAGRHFASWASGYRRPPPGRPPTHAPDVSSMGRAGGWLEAERANLHAAVGHAAAQGRLKYATQIPAAVSGFLAVRGHWDQFAALLQAALVAAREAGDRLGEADTLGALGVVQAERGDYPAAAASHQQALALARSAGDRPAEAAALLGLGLVQLLTGDYPAAAASQQQSLALFRDLGDLDGQADALNCLGVVQHETGDYRAAATSQEQSLALCRHLGNLLGQAHALNDLGLVQQETGGYRAAAASHQQALTLLADLGDLDGQAQVLNCLGELATRTANTGQARERHTQALAIARHLGAPLEEARALEGLGHSHLHDGNPGQAAAHLQHALAIYQRIGAPAARSVQQTLQDHNLTSTTERQPTTPPIAKAINPQTRATPPRSR